VLALCQALTAQYSIHAADRNIGAILVMYAGTEHLIRVLLRARLQPCEALLTRGEAPVQGCTEG